MTEKQLIKKLNKYVGSEEKGWLKVAAFCNYETTEACKIWVKRGSIPSYHHNKLEKLLNGEASVEIQFK